MRNLTESEYNIVYNAYTKENRGLSYCSKLVNASPSTIRRILVEHGIAIRNFSEAAKLSNKNRELYKDKNYFKHPSHNMAWILGFIASDGTVRKDKNEIKIGLSIKDKEILEKIKQELQLQVDIKEYITGNGYEACSLTWTCEEHKQDLALYGITPQKTFTLKPPIKLPKEFYIDYIRGYFDGDGSINLIPNSNSRGNGNLRWQICGANKEFLQWIIDTLYTEYSIQKVNIYQQLRINTLYYFQYSSRATRQIYNILYSNNSLYLQRKKERFDEIITLIKPIE